MKNLVVYASYNGYTKECAEAIGALLGKETQVIDCASNREHMDISSAQLVILGGAIHMGRVKGSLRAFCKKYHSELQQKKIGLFLCGTDEKGQERLFSTNFPQLMKDTHPVLGWFGARIIFEQHDVITQAILRKILKTSEDIHDERPQEVQSFALRCKEL